MAALAYIGEGGFTYDEIMNMSSLDRRFYLRRLTQYKEAEAEAMKKASRPSSSPRMRRSGRK